MIPFPMITSGRLAALSNATADNTALLSATITGGTGHLGGQLIKIELTMIALMNKLLKTTTAAHSDRLKQCQALFCYSNFVVEWYFSGKFIA